jgi:hypothetical protein
MNEIRNIVSEKNWKLLISNYSIKDICSSLSFKEVMYVAEQIFYDDIEDKDNQQFALELTLEIANFFKDDWNKDWKNDVFIGNFCEMLWRYDERYFYYKRAYDKLIVPPTEL